MVNYAVKLLLVMLLTSCASKKAIEPKSILNNIPENWGINTPVTINISDVDGGYATSVDGYYPLYATWALAAEANRSGSGTHTHSFDANESRVQSTYYMPNDPAETDGVQYHGNFNPEHFHSGKISGVIYLNNEDDTVFKKDEYRHKGKKGEMILFPSETMHSVERQEKDYERITFAFNVNYKE